MSTQTVIETKTKLKKPTLYKVVLHNDDYTPQDFVISILRDLFRKSEAEAFSLMLNVHNSGRGIAGIFTREIAEQKVSEVGTIAKHYGHPLKTTSEPE